MSLVCAFRVFLPALLWPTLFVMIASFHHRYLLFFLFGAEASASPYFFPAVALYARFFYPHARRLPAAAVIGSGDVSYCVAPASFALIPLIGFWGCFV